MYTPTCNPPSSPINTMGDDYVPLMEEPIVATVRIDEKLSSWKNPCSSMRMIAPTTTSVLGTTTGLSGITDSEPSLDTRTEDAIRLLTQFIFDSMRTNDNTKHQPPSTRSSTEQQQPKASRQQHQLEDNETYLAGSASSMSCCCLLADQHLPDVFLPLYNAITMLQSHANLARQEAVEAVYEATTAQRQAKLWKHRAVMLSQQCSTWHEMNVQLKQQNVQLTQQRTLLKRAYKQLIHEQASRAIHQVETALLMHEDNLRCNNSTEGTSATEVSFDEEEEEELVETDAYKHVVVLHDEKTTTPSNSSAASSSVVVASSSKLSSNYKPLQLQVSAASLQKQLLQKHRRRPRTQITSEDLVVVTSSVRDDDVPSSIVMYQS